MARLAMIWLVASALVACGGDDEGGAGEGGGSGMNAGMSGMSSGGASGSSGMGGGTGGQSGTSGMSGAGGAGSGGSGGGTPSGNGQVVAPWDELCVATFTADYDVLDFGDVAFTAKSGERYLMAAASSFAGTAIFYLTPEGQVEFEIEDDAPFTSDCDGSGSDHAAVFVDTVVYADEALTMELCTLEAGTHAPGSVDYAIAGDDIFTSSTYEVSFSGLDSFCDGMSSGFVEGVSVTVGSGSYTQIALATVLAP